MLSAEVQVWRGEENDYGGDFLGEELAGSGGDLRCNEHTAMFMNVVTDHSHGKRRSPPPP